MVYIPQERLQSIEAGIHAWKVFKETSKEIAEINLTKTLEEK